MSAEETSVAAEAAVKPKKPATEFVKVTMEDGSEMEFAGAEDSPRKRKLLKDSTIKEDGSVVVNLAFRNGKKIAYTLNPALILAFAAHGAEQKLGDAAAGEVDIDDMVLSIEDVIERLDKGEWNAVRESSGMAGTSVLLQALVQVTGRPVADLKTWLKTKSAADKTALRNSDKLRPVVQEIEAKKAAKTAGVDTNALLAEIGG